MARISEQSIEKVRNAADIVDVISSYIELKQRGRNFFGLCPFHNEKTPSFSVNPEKQIYKCFGCGSGGGSINFIMEIENLEFVDAIKKLAQSYSVELEITGGDSKQFRDLKTQLLGIHEIVSIHYQNLLVNSPEGEKAMGYLTERGLSEDIISEFKIGYSLDSFDNVLKFLQKEAFSAEAMKASGLFIDSKKGYIDRFRSRIMFPIKNYNGNTIAFGGRIFNKDDPAKYLNSPETPIYTKSNVLYGLDVNAKSIKEEKKIILVEGYMDLLQLAQYKIRNCVAISGTAFTNQHVQLLKRFSNNVFVTFDGDEAGIKASIRCGYILAAAAIEAKIVTPPENLDPDDWVRQDKGKELLSSLSEAKDVIKTHYMLFSKNHPEGSLSINEFIQECLGEIINLQDPILRDLMIKRLSELTTVNHNSILAVLKEKIAKKNQFKQQDSQNIKDEKVIIHKSFSTQLYDDLIRLCCVEDVKIRKFIFENLNIDWIISKKHKSIYDQVYIHLKSENEPPANIITEQIIDKETRQKFIDLTFDLNKFKPSLDIAKDCLVRLEQDILKTQLNSLREKLKNNDNQSNDVLAQLFSLEKNISNLKNKYNAQ